MEALARILEPFDVEIILAALRGKPTVFDVDGRFEASTWGPPTTGFLRRPTSTCVIGR